MPKAKKTVSKKPPKKKNSLPIITIIIAVVALAILGFMGYSVYTYYQSEQEKEGFFACNQDGTVCELSQHIHADIDVTVCGKEIIFPKEAGRTDEQHTHKETNLMHLHARLKVDPQTKEPLNPTRRQVQAFLDQMDFQFPDTCPDNPNPTMTVYVNDIESSESLDYVWVDGDRIEIEYE